MKKFFNFEVIAILLLAVLVIVAASLSPQSSHLGALICWVLVAVIYMLRTRKAEKQLITEQEYNLELCNYQAEQAKRIKELEREKEAADNSAADELKQAQAKILVLEKQLREADAKAADLAKPVETIKAEKPQVKKPRQKKSITDIKATLNQKDKEKK